jgi:hypothetical protein
MTLGARGKLVVLGILLALGVTLTYFQMRGRLPQPWGTLSSIGYITIIGLVLWARIVPLPEGLLGAPLGGRLKNLGKAGVWALASLLWVGVLVRLVSDTILGAVILLAPFFALFGMSTYFLAKAAGFLGKAGSDADV